MSALRLAAAAALALSPLASAHAQGATQVVDVASFYFAPKPIHLAAGRQVTLTFVNRSGSGHDFTAPRFFAKSRIISGGAPEGEIELAPHQTRSITLVPSAGTYSAHCSHFMHKQFGMTDTIVVN
jgi:plastocyanin